MVDKPKRQKLPDRTYVSLSEALTWIAFGEPLNTQGLKAQVEGERPINTDRPEERLRRFFAGKIEEMPGGPGICRFADRQAGLDKLADAWRQLRESVDREAIKARGRHTRFYSLADAHLADAEELTGSMLATFSQFDVTTGGIRRQPYGSPEVIWRDDPCSFDREFDIADDNGRAAEGYLFVEIERDGLMRTDAVRPVSRAPSVKADYAPADETIIAKAEEMKLRGLDGRTIASEMRFEAGFENVATTHVRELIKGRWKPGGRPRRKGA